MNLLATCIIYLKFVSKDYFILCLWGRNGDLKPHDSEHQTPHSLIKMDSRLDTILKHGLLLLALPKNVDFFCIRG